MNTQNLSFLQNVLMCMAGFSGEPLRSPEACAWRASCCSFNRRIETSQRCRTIPANEWSLQDCEVLVRCIFCGGETRVLSAAMKPKPVPTAAASLSQEELANIGRALKYFEGQTSVERGSGKVKPSVSSSKTPAGKGKAPVKRAGGAGSVAAKRSVLTVKKPSSKCAAVASKVRAKDVGGPSKVIAKRPVAVSVKAEAANGKAKAPRTAASRVAKPVNPVSSSKKGKASGETSGGVTKPKKPGPKKVGASVTCEPSTQAEKKTLPAKGTVSPPRVSLKMNVSEMKAEALVRGHSVKELPSKKADLLYFLGDGTICLKDSAEYTAFEALKAKMMAEKDSHVYRNRNDGTREKVREKERRRETEAEARRLEIERKERSARSSMREKEISDQAHLHSSFRCLAVHPCLLADAKLLSRYGAPRLTNSSCNICSMGYPSFLQHRVYYSCDKCDFDVCSDCYRQHNMSPAEKRAHALKVEEEKAKAQAAEEAAQAEAEAAYDKKQFREAAVTPPDSAKQRGLGFGFTVWCGNGYYNDSFHRNNGPIEKEFDTEWVTREEANERARYLFYWRNPWGVEASELCEPEEKENSSGCMKFEERAGDSESWMVGVVPSSSFLHLDYATLKRHNHDRSSQERIGFF